MENNLVDPLFAWFGKERKLYPLAARCMEQQILWKLPQEPFEEISALKLVATFAMEVTLSKTPRGRLDFGSRKERFLTGRAILLTGSMSKMLAVARL